MTRCPICGEPADPAFTARVRNEHDARCLQCGSCGFLFVENPHWLEAAHREAINASDTGLVRRNLDAARRISSVILACLDRRGTFLDEAGGTGLFVRLMRDRGLDFRWRDPYATNVFARGFEVPSPDARYEAITWFECAEHVRDPIAAVGRLLAQTDVLVLSTLLLPSPAPAPDRWWYYGWDHGQHVSFYTRGALEALARRSGARCLSDGRTMHLITRRPIHPLALRLALLASAVIDPIGTRLLCRPLTESDHLHLKGRP